MAVVAAGIITALIVLIIMNAGQVIIQVIANLLYAPAVLASWVLDFVQVLFRKLAGLDTTYVKDDQLGNLIEQDNDILLSILTSETVLETFMAMCIVGICLLMITSVVQMIRVEYTTEGSKNNKFTILGSALKGFSYFLIVPIALILGIMVSNAILQAVDRATSSKGAATISGSIFVAAAAQANRVRTDNRVGIASLLMGEDTSTIIIYDAEDNSFGGKNPDFYEKYFGINDTGDPLENRRAVADKVDYAFSRGSLVSLLGGGSLTVLDSGDVERLDWKDNPDFDPWLSYDNGWVVNQYYNLTEMNWLILLVGLGFCIVPLFMAMFGLIMRIYTVTILFIISPGIIGLWPIDNGKAFQSWRSKVVGSVISAYGTVVAINLYLVVAGSFDKIYLFNWRKPENGADYMTLLNKLIDQIDVVNLVVKALFVIVGAVMIGNLSKTISGLIGAEDSGATGGEVGGKAVKAVGTVVAGGAMAGAAAIKAAKGAKGIAQGVANTKAGKWVGSKIKNTGSKIANSKTATKVKSGLERLDNTKFGKKVKSFGGTLGKAGTKIANIVTRGKYGQMMDDKNTYDELTEQGETIESLSEAYKNAQDSGKKAEIAEQIQAMQRHTARGAKSKMRQQQFMSLGSNFFKNSSLGKSLNTATAGLIPGLGGDAWEKAGSAAAKKDQGYSEYKEIVDAINKAKPDNKEKGKAKGILEVFNKGNGALEHENARNTIYDNAIKVNGDETVDLLQQIYRAIKDKDPEKVKTLQGNFNARADLMGSMGITGTDTWKSALANMIQSGDFSGLKGLQAQISGSKGSVATISDESLNEMTSKLIEMGTKGITTFESLAKAAAHAYSEKSGKPEVAISAMTSELESQNDEIIRLLGQMVDKLDK